MHKPRVLAITKSDLLDEELQAEMEKEVPEGIPYVFISSVAQKNVTELKDLLWKEINR
jgi:GTP-binding protein